MRSYHHNPRPENGLRTVLLKGNFCASRSVFIAELHYVLSTCHLMTCHQSLCCVMSFCHNNVVLADIVIVLLPVCVRSDGEDGVVVLHPPGLLLPRTVGMVDTVTHHQDGSRLLVLAVLPVAAVVSVGEEPGPVDLPVVNDPVLTRGRVFIDHQTLKYFQYKTIPALLGVITRSLPCTPKCRGG